ncbi:stage IV sporulation protein B [Clostridium carboxidivorans P7]|uniref:Stage IV sporulation protein B n=2 Tax=Clostridium TaxID=1485 RepID=C6PQQ4_9CLOT|nr:SpoIVB peptidase [Clostridium carboxidivorans]AKN34039.1 stage IV sporulation protein B [Clostridium carboxidivorans P7]EET88426.1 stage IV sporulation protein B [Clostridium carboxidivorans P7]
MDKKIKKMLCCILIPILLLMIVSYYKAQNIPTTIFIREGESLKSDNLIKLREAYKTENIDMEDKKVSVNLLGILPVKLVSLKSVSNSIVLYPGGQPVGVKLNTKGVLVVALSDIRTEKEKIASPAALAGIQIGDNIIKINNCLVKSSEDVQKQINDSNGEELKIIIDRKGEEIEKKVRPIKNPEDDNLKIGLWIRDCTAGVGTLTFYDEKTGMFAALGHPITDIDTGTILNISSGEIVPSSIVSVKRGLKGNPGELKGIFVNEEKILGKIYKNTKCGIFGKGSSELINRNVKPMKIALRNEIKEGPAKILTTVEGEKPKFYDIRIEKLLAQDSPGPKSMVIKITDPVLLEKTGGIVQGMSGSPIIQEGKIIGAVTHVLINKPDTGYGIYIEWMLKDANILSK